MKYLYIAVKLGHPGIEFDAIGFEDEAEMLAFCQRRPEYVSFTTQTMSLKEAVELFEKY